MKTGRIRHLAGLKNGELLAAAEKAGFEALLTVDQGIEYRQNLISRKLAFVILRAKSNRLEDLLALVPIFLARVRSIEPGKLVRIEAASRAE